MYTVLHHEFYIFSQAWIWCAYVYYINFSSDINIVGNIYWEICNTASHLPGFHTTWLWRSTQTTRVLLQSSSKKSQPLDPQTKRFRTATAFDVTRLVTVKGWFWNLKHFALLALHITSLHFAALNLKSAQNKLLNILWRVLELGDREKQDTKYVEFSPLNYSPLRTFNSKGFLLYRAFTTTHIFYFINNIHIFEQKTWSTAVISPISIFSRKLDVVQSSI